MISENTENMCHYSEKYNYFNSENMENENMHFILEESSPAGDQQKYVLLQ